MIRFDAYSATARGLKPEQALPLFWKVGDVVKAGESISTVGSSGGQDTPALYFAIRQQGHPSDPAQWCRAQG